jgi:hypothetical protein
MIDEEASNCYSDSCKEVEPVKEKGIIVTMMMS